MSQDPEKRGLISLMLGQQVAIKYLSGPDITDENVEQVVEEGQVLKGELEARTATFYLRAYSDLGIEVSREAESSSSEIFLPWSAVLAIWGPSRESLEQHATKNTVRERSRRAEGSVLRNRQELMNQLVDARTPSEVASARAAADSWLATHPGDGDVRLAREHLRSAYPEEDLEEGSPT